MTFFGIMLFCVVVVAIYGLCILVERAVRRTSHFFTHGTRRWFLLGAIVVSLVLVPLLFKSCGGSNPTVINKKSGSATVVCPSSTPPAPAEKSQYFQLKKGESHTIRIWPGWQAWAVGGAIKIARPHGKERTLFPDSRISLGPQFDPEDITFTGIESSTTGFNLSGRW